MGIKIKRLMKHKVETAKADRNRMSNMSRMQLSKFLHSSYRCSFFPLCAAFVQPFSCFSFHHSMGEDNSIPLSASPN